MRECKARWDAIYGDDNEQDRIDAKRAAYLEQAGKTECECGRVIPKDGVIKCSACQHEGCRHCMIKLTNGSYCDNDCIDTVLSGLEKFVQQVENDLPRILENAEYEPDIAPQGLTPEQRDCHYALQCGVMQGKNSITVEIVKDLMKEIK